MTEPLRDLERAHLADPQDLVALRAFAEDRRRRGLEHLPAVIRADPWKSFRTCELIARAAVTFRLPTPWVGVLERLFRDDGEPFWVDDPWAGSAGGAAREQA